MIPAGRRAFGLYVSVESAELLIDVGGVGVRVVADPTYVDFATARVGNRPMVGRPEIELRLSEATPPPPARVPDQHLESVDAWFESDAVWMQIGRSVVRSSPHEVIIGGSLHTDVDHKSIDLMVQFGLAAAVANPDRMMVHGAVVARDESALLVIGKSGAGKSTVATAALVDGWDLLTDDLAVARPGAGTVAGVARPPRLPSDVALVHDLQGQTERGDRARLVLPAETLAIGDRRLVGVVVVGHGSTGSLERIDAADLGAIDDALAVPPFRPVIRRHLASAAALVSKPVFRLLHSADPDVRLRRAAELLDEALELSLSD